jgi:hypothetical protein
MARTGEEMRCRAQVMRRGLTHGEWRAIACMNSAIQRHCPFVELTGPYPTYPRGRKLAVRKEHRPVIADTVSAQQA